MAQARASGNAVLRHAIRSETKLFASELATDLARFPVLREWSTADLQMLAGMFVETMISAVEAFFEASAGGGGAPTPAAEARLAKLTERQLRLLALAIPQWRSRPWARITEPHRLRSPDVDRAAAQGVQGSRRDVVVRLG